MTKKQKNVLFKWGATLIAIFTALILFVPLLPVSDEAVLEETSWFKFVDWFAKLNDHFQQNALVYILALVLIGGLVLFYRKKR